MTDLRLPFSCHNGGRGDFRSVVITVLAVIQLDLPILMDSPGIQYVVWDFTFRG